MVHPSLADLASVPLFSSLSDAELRAIRPLFTVRAYPKGAIVATEGDRLEMFNVILSGRIQFFWRNDEGRQVKLGIDGPGGHFADVTLTGERILMSVTTLEPLRVASIPLADVKPLLLRHPVVAVALLGDVVERLRRLVQRTQAFTMHDVYGRVVQLLRANAVERDGRTVVERMSQAEIGERVGATREMVGRVLRELGRGGYVEIARGRITILKVPPPRW